MSRKTARAAAMQMIFEKTSGGQGGEETLQMIYDELRELPLPGDLSVDPDEPGSDDRAYISTAFEGVTAHREEIDAKIAKTAVGWTLDRMNLVDLTILRLAVWEILYAEKIPHSVSVAEALELIQQYSDPEDKAFVNGILGTIVREAESAR
ncbi:MAG: transcription antitermination factor NusB [Clostridia bacterium]|nr:transcription antitermination factor NusB [Clostridia bacterium]